MRKLRIKRRPCLSRVNRKRTKGHVLNKDKEASEEAVGSSL